mmetsp:Transcript_10883/g.17823  ORF Transcript_10883/g.17823 Transcript_10883/m.17823 type:complete len:462 (+) Transcript_10883:83-1468(+)|eukprot:CAMPEP_0203766384 /NCGR_PEP_ID=MMETSP0099_2-20121227/386_1 /ASSEMBLY_ACC=CAM_ASM_000209 /TAXON_ID=96639 /ORGANISM=" , Strain NY0313808BC1" /LENGTH=461 /DNA_ID=CAMNT_0050662725 /DNA_START=56 /DNA_END=1441 /DNA_ORIENTATION=-
MSEDAVYAGVKVGGSSLSYYNRISFEVCVGLYSLAFVYAMMQVLFRYWADRERQRALDILRERAMEESASAVSVGEVLPSSAALLRTREPIVTALNRSRLFYVSRNLAFAFLLRTVWLVLTVENIAPKVDMSNEENKSCYNVHTFVSAANRLAQLLCFTAYTSVVGFWAEVLRQHEKAKNSRAGLSAQAEIASALAQSTTRRRPGEVMVPVPDLFTAGNDGEQQNGDGAVHDQEGFAAICSIFWVLLTPDMIQILLNFWAYVLIFVFLCVQWFECDKEEYNKIDKAETMTIAFFFAILSIMYLIYGVRLVRVLGTVKLPVGGRIKRNTIVLIVVCVSCFILRGSLFLMNPLFHFTLTGFIGKLAYPWFFYPVPELLPALLILHLTTPHPRRMRVDAETPLLLPPMEATTSTSDVSLVEHEDGSEFEGNECQHRLDGFGSIDKATVVSSEATQNGRLNLFWA